MKDIIINTSYAVVTESGIMGTRISPVFLDYAIVNNTNYDLILDSIIVSVKIDFIFFQIRVKDYSLYRNIRLSSKHQFRRNLSLDSIIQRHGVHEVILIEVSTNGRKYISEKVSLK